MEWPLTCRNLVTDIACSSRMTRWGDVVEPDKKPWQISTAVTLGVSWGAFLGVIMWEGDVLFLLIHIVLQALFWGMLFVAVAILRNKGIAPRHTRLPARLPEWPTEDVLELTEAFVDEASIESDIRHAVSMFEISVLGNIQREHINDVLTQSADAQVAKAEKFVSDCYLDHAVPEIYHQMIEWVVSEGSEQTARSLPVVPISFFFDEAHVAGLHYVEWDMKGILYRISGEELEPTSPNAPRTHEYAKFKLEVNGRLVFEYIGLRQIGKSPDWSYGRIISIKVGPWIPPVIELYTQLIDHKVDVRHRNDASRRRSKLDRIDLGNFGSGIGWSG